MSGEVSPTGADIDLRRAGLGWAAAWFVGGLLSSSVFSASGADSIGAAGPQWLLAAQLCSWIPTLLMATYLAREVGARSIVDGYALRVRPVDLLGIVIGVATQLLLPWVVYAPLRAVWPDTFAIDEVERPARELWDGASGAGIVLLVVLVAICAPLVEEILYRGLLHGAAVRALGRGVGLVLVALVFAAVHFQTAGLPGLFVVGLVLGACTLRTGRLGMAVLAHVAFNAAGLAVVAAR